MGWPALQKYKQTLRRSSVDSSTLTISSIAIAMSHFRISNSDPFQFRLLWR